MSDSSNQGVTLTPEFTALFPQLFEAKCVKRNGKEVGDPIYSNTALFDPEQAGEALEAMKRVALAVAKAKWPGRDLKAAMQAGEFKWPFASGDKVKADVVKKGKKGDIYGEGQVVLRMKSKFQPIVCDERKNDIIDTKRIYSGVRAVAEVNFVAYDGVDGGNDGIACYINAFMRVGDGERLIGRTAREVFAGIDGGKSDHDATDGLDDEIPF